MAKYYSSQEIQNLAHLHELPCKYTNLDTKTQDYHRAVFDEIVYGYYLANMDQINNNTVPFSITRIRKRLGRYGKGGKGYWWDWLHQNFPLVNILSVGNSIKGVNSMAQPKDIPLDILLASGNGRDIVEALYKDFDDDADIHLAPINTYSLENYILATTAENNLNPKIQTNLKQARLILMVAKQCNNQLPQVVNYSAFGRTYYKGLNLQNVHKTVRHAALGACYSVDIDASVFNWKYAMVPFNQDLTYTRELIQDKTRVRKRLAQLVFGNTNDHSINTIKRVLTAISFGARAKTRCWFKNESNKWTQGAISEIVYSKELRELVFNDSWMKNFMNEQERINQYIGDDLARAAKNKDIPEKYLKDLKSERGRISKGKLIAWAYQQSEQQIMTEMLKWSRTEALLQVHDGVYFLTKPDMPSMQTVLQQQWPLATLSLETINNYHYRNRELDQQHLEHIRQEETLANGGTDPRTSGIHTEALAVKKYDPHAEPNWEQINSSNLMEEYYQHFPEDRPQDPNMPSFAKKRLLH